MQNLSELTPRLVEAQVEFVLIGGFAAVAHGATLVTVMCLNLLRFIDWVASLLGYLV
ncbi:MAG TPA: hypothetical protein VL361_20175 [Candidatus Limnocylindrales bacterium]|nr:hypothetical protein [Candidatus Limnocylindrales bacterium]